MSAKELMGNFVSMSEERIRDNAGTILSALSLLASVEDGEGIVRELREAPAVFNEYGTSIDISGDTLDKAAARIALDAQEKAALKAELASVKAERDALKERIWQIRVELGALFTMLPNEVPGLAMEVCERDADRQCLFRAFELAAHKEGA